jgi:hypothetical protein
MRGEEAAERRGVVCLADDQFIVAAGCENKGKLALEVGRKFRTLQGVKVFVENVDLVVVPFV